jgi:hypothetical protein
MRTSWKFSIIATAAMCVGAAGGNQARAQVDPVTVTQVLTALNSAIQTMQLIDDCSSLDRMRRMGTLLVNLAKDPIPNQVRGTPYQEIRDAIGASKMQCKCVAALVTAAGGGASWGNFLIYMNRKGEC